MAESEKGTSTAGSKKESASLDEEIGTDFLSTWKSVKMPKDDIDFNVETIPRNGKKSFNFDKLDDFELGGDFDTSFKLDMPDLDFSSPLKKTEKPKENSCKDFILQKQEAKQNKFSFTFDFNELGSFDLDTNSLKGEKKPSKCMENSESDSSIKHDKDQDSKTKLVTGADMFENNENKKLANSESMTTSKSEYFTNSHIEPDITTVAGPSILSSFRDPDMSRETWASTQKHITTAEEGKGEFHRSEWNKELLERTGFRKPCAEQAVSVQSVSGDAMGQEALFQFPKGLVSLDPVKSNSAGEQDNSTRSICSSQSRNSSPVNSDNSRCWPAASMMESPNTSPEFQNHQGDQNKVTGGNKTLNESAQGHKDVVINSVADVSRKMFNGKKNTGEKQNSGSKLLLSPLDRDSRIDTLISVKEKGTSALQLKSLNMLANNASQQTSASSPKQLYAIHNKKIETMHLCPANEKRESMQSDEQAGNQKGGILKSYGRAVTKSVSVILGREKNGDSGTSPFQVHPYNLPERTAVYSTAKSIDPNLSSCTALNKNSKIISVERQGISPKGDIKCDISGLTISRKIKPNSTSPNSSVQKERKSGRHLEGNLRMLLNSTSKETNSVIAEKHALLIPPLKRKLLEESKADPMTLNPLKRVTESPIERRNSSEASPKIDRRMVSGTEKPVVRHGDACVDHLTTSDVSVVGSMMDIEVPILVENDGTVEKAEACAKELDDICNMLKKKNEEAKELLVRTTVNNNTLLMLNHPMFEEKIRVLQRFATSLLSKEF